MDLFLNGDQVREMIKTAETEGEVIVVRCIRKTKASKDGGPDKGELYDLHCGTKPADYVAKTAKDRSAEDAGSDVLTVYATNRKDEKTGIYGCFRRVNLAQVQKVIYKGKEWEVKMS